MCWVADTSDSNYVIDFVPGRKGAIVATGDSGHGFKMLPLVGRWIQKVIEEQRQSEERWMWKRPAAGQEDISWRVGKLYDLGAEQRMKSML
jgi:sarcosine oxidase/L-pipecolate oxidase